ncbi:sulfite reductase (NADPH) flavoprotein alpha-component [Roseateles sp. YR242]|uniref:sulfite reductase subunit alpha n=1 Tax=Roseateles sp. YR242 TaxID=1855305 RepID=UPI0008D5E6BD|nr:sulfite reductase subunit alpha [Roseateles sp. YR242]SEL28584.1 sulfite reductase (NADPH) flavoprotein alpha-component [Roseateles sp. YR242]
MIWSRLALALLFVLLYVVLCAAVWWRHRGLQRRAAVEAAALLPTADAGPTVLVLHASQTGQGEELAWQTAKSLHLAGMPVRVCALGQLQRADLLTARHALVIASTYGEGDAPDSAATFARDFMADDQPLDLRGLQVGVMALGDRTYAHFCGFGRAVDAWFLRQGAVPLFDRIEVDRADPAAITAWRQRLSHVAGTADMPDHADQANNADWAGPIFQPWRLAARTHLNPGSQGGPVFHLALLPPDGEPLPDWAAGDLVQVLPDADPGRPREYTIASLPTRGCVELMVRQTRRDDGELGRASGLLTDQLAVGGLVPLRLRAHPGFRIGENAARPLILIGNGTGLAGLRAHLQARSAEQASTVPASTRPVAPAWLLFGERQSAHDAHYRDEIEAWQRAGVLRHVDWAFSRDQAERVHVQHLLARHAQRLREWVADGAAIYVCGSLQGMAGAVDAVLRETVGDGVVDALIQQGRYRRDVY